MDLVRKTYNTRGDITSVRVHRGVDEPAVLGGSTIYKMFLEAGPDVLAITFDKGNDGTIRWERM